MSDANLKALVNLWANRMNETTSSLPSDIANVEKVRTRLHEVLEHRAELLAALKEIADIIQGGDKLQTCEPWAQELIGRARAVIAKAEGKELGR